MRTFEERQPFTRDELLIVFNDQVARTEKQWGKDNYYTDLERRWKDERLQKFDAGEVVLVESRSFVASYGNGCGDFQEEIYSDGHVKVACFGYLD